MALCSFSSSLAMESCTLVDNTFINEFLPLAPDTAVKVYLYGLSLCNSPSRDDNSLESICQVLSLTEDQVLDAFNYWQSVGLVQIVAKTPFEVKYLSVKESSGNSKLRPKAKYKDFNEQVQSILSGRMISPVEYNEYYHLIENRHFEPEALVMIIKYCTVIKDNTINYPYILKVANSFDHEGIKTATALEAKFLEQEKSSAEIKNILKTLGLNRDADLDERNLYLKWVNNYGFTDGVIKEVAKLQNKKGGMNKLDETLSKLYEQKLFTMEEIENYSKEKESLYQIAKKVTATLGLYYQNLESVVEVYVKDWVNKGYDEQTLTLLSTYCFKQDIKSLSLMNEVVLKLYKLGIVSIQAINEYIEGIVQTDNFVKEILRKLGIVRKVNSSDRDFYKTWTEDWNFSLDIIDLVCEKSKNASNPIRYMNKLLLSLHSKNVQTRKQAENELSKVADNKVENKHGFAEREYTSEELNALFDSLDDIEV